MLKEMPAIKQLLRRTLATTTLNPTPFPLPPPPNHQRMLTPTRYRDRRTLAKGARISVGVAHVKPPTVIKSVTLYLPPNNHNNNRILCTSNHSSSSSSSPIEERENNNVKLLFSRVSSPSNNSSSGSHQTLVTDMGHERKANNGVNNNDDDNEQLPEKGCSKLLTLPTLLTLARVAAIPVFISTFYVKNWWGTTATTSIFVIAAITDWLDGYLARKMSLGTAFGAFLDPVADKLMVAATLVLLCSRPPETSIFGDLPWLFPVPAIAIIGREITMSAVREWAASQNTKLLQAVAVNNLGKWKTATQMAALTILLVTRDTSLSDPGPLVATGVVLLYISAGLAVWSLFVYMRKIWKVLLK